MPRNVIASFMLSLNAATLQIAILVLLLSWFGGFLGMLCDEDHECSAIYIPVTITGVLVPTSVEMLLKFNHWE